MASKRHGRSGNFKTQLSMKLSGILRHGKDGFKRHIDSNGWLEIDILLKELHFCQSNSVSCEQIFELVSTDDKHRFKISEDRLKIKANQGHTIKITDTSLQRMNLVQAASYLAVTHGTYYKYLDQILKNGLSKMKRTHIHLTASDRVDPSMGVVSGYKNNSEILIYIDLCKAIKDGIDFFVSENNVVLCPGNDAGYLDPTYFAKIIDRKTNEDLLKSKR